MDHVLGFKCSLCGQEYDLSQVEYVCPKHGDMGNLDVVYDLKKVAKKLTKRKLADNTNYSIWRYRALLPIRPDSPALPLQIGGTPMYRCTRLAERMGFRSLYIKNEGANPTGVFKAAAASSS